MDYASEQAMEMEALEAILMGDLVPYDSNLPDDWPAVGPTYKVAVVPDEEGEENGPASLIAELVWAHTATYPDSAPAWKLMAGKGLSSADISDGCVVLEGIVEENLGMAMIFTMVTALKEWLRGKLNVEEEVDPEEARRRAEEAEEAARAAKRAYGHPVTVDSFQSWKEKFDAEMAAIKARAIEVAKVENKGEVRLTGRQYFMREVAGDELDEEAVSGEDDGTMFEDDEDDDDFVPGDDDDVDYDDDDDDGMLDEYLAGKR